MSSSETDNYGLVPPDVVKGMTTLSKDVFTKKVSLPGLKIARKNLGSTEKLWKKLQLRCRGIKAVAQLGDNDPLKSTHSLLLLDPRKLSTSQISDEAKKTLGFPDGELEHFEVEFNYDNWSVPDVMRAVLPDDTESISSFSTIGHIAHLNLKEWALPYKGLIGQVIIDKVPTVKTVINKLNQIDNTFRNFQMELLAGEENYVTKVREHDCTFEMDFSKVYWNPRLSTEHTRVVDLIKPESVVYDVFAGVGPFAIPLGRKKRCKVFANDLNPSSFQYLERNVKLNKMKGFGCVQCYNLDGRDFIKTVIKKDLTELILSISDVASKNNSNNISVTEDFITDPINLHKKIPTLTSLVEEKDKKEKLSHPSTFVVMNLPGLAVEFLDAFASLLYDLPANVLSQYKHWESVLPTVHCYSFTPKIDDEDGEVKARAEAALGSNLPRDFSIRNVRNVSPNKEMVCLSFKLWSDLVISSPVQAAQENIDDEPDMKRQKIST